jgi:TPR repeat protein
MRRECHSSMRANAEASAQQGRDREAAQKVTDAERAARARAGPACERGDPRSCLTVAIYDERHGGARTVIASAYTVACRGALAFGCYGAGRFEMDPGAARSLFERGCKLGEPRSCDAVAEADPARSAAFHEAACRLSDFGACEKAGFAFLYGSGVPVDRARARALLTRGCDHADAASCALLADMH